MFSPSFSTLEMNVRFLSFVGQLCLSHLFLFPCRSDFQPDPQCVEIAFDTVAFWRACLTVILILDLI